MVGWGCRETGFQPQTQTIELQNIKKKCNYRPSDLGNVYPTRASGRVPGISFGNKIIRFTENMYIYIK